MADYLIYLPLEPYLRQWFVARHGGQEPVRLIRGSIESKRLKLLLEQPPSDYRPQLPSMDYTSVIVPAFPGKDYRSYNYLNPTSVTALVSTIKDLLDLQLHDFYAKCYFKGVKIDYMIEAWMFQNGIDYNETNCNSIKKRLDRIRNIVRCHKYRQRKRQ